MSERAPQTLKELEDWIRTDLTRREHRQAQIVPTIWYIDSTYQKLVSLQPNQPAWVVVEIPESSALTKTIRDVYGQEGETEPGLYVTLHSGDAVQFGEVIADPVPSAENGTRVLRLFVPVTVLSSASSEVHCTYDLNLSGHALGEGVFTIPVQVVYPR